MQIAIGCVLPRRCAHTPDDEVEREREAEDDDTEDDHEPEDDRIL
jgi:hypothetical protein